MQNAEHGAERAYIGLMLGLMEGCGCKQGVGVGGTWMVWVDGGALSWRNTSQQLLLKSTCQLQQDPRKVSLCAAWWNEISANESPNPTDSCTKCVARFCLPAAKTNWSKTLVVWGRY